MGPSHANQLISQLRVPDNDSWEVGVNTRRERAVGRCENMRNNLFFKKYRWKSWHDTGTGHRCQSWEVLFTSKGQEWFHYKKESVIKSTVFFFKLACWDDDKRRCYCGFSALRQELNWLYSSPDILLVKDVGGLQTKSNPLPLWRPLKGAHGI